MATGRIFARRASGLPARRELASILNKSVKSLTPDEIKNIADLHHEYDALVIARIDAAQRYDAEANRLHKQFKYDLALEFFGEKGHPKADYIFTFATNMQPD